MQKSVSPEHNVKVCGKTTGVVGLTFRLGVEAHFNAVLVRKCAPFLITQRQPCAIGYSGQKQQNGKSFPILEELV